MGFRPDDVRKRIANRKKERERHEKKFQPHMLIADDEEKHGFDRMPSYELDPSEGGHPLFRKEMFIFKILVSVCLVLVVAILFRNQSSTFDPARDFVKKTMEKDFQFATVSVWYEEKFGEPLAFFQAPNEQNGEGDTLEQQYALPASGRILEEFDVNGQRIMIETEKDANIPAMDEGFIRFIGEKEGFGKTVIIKHGDNSETWYGNLSNISVSLYEYIEKGKNVGKVTNGAEDDKGAFYFALKKGDDFVDPIQVIQFE